jgi:hypothetical protein
MGLTYEGEVDHDAGSENQGAKKSPGYFSGALFQFQWG